MPRASKPRIGAERRPPSADEPVARVSRKRERVILEVAAAIAEGRDVDWPSLLETTDPRARPDLLALRGLQQIAATSRGPDDVLFTWGPLQVLERVGAGGFGEVFRAWDPSLEREVALKLRHLRRPGHRSESSAVGSSDSLAEARRLGRLRHPNVLIVYGVEEYDGRAGLWTEFVHGETLEKRLERGGPLPPAELAAAARDLCQALAAVHDAGIVHGDVKAANVMLDGGGRTILMDFGAGTILGASEGARAGTPLVMAPELFAEGSAPTIASDLYALGVLLHRLACGRYPVEARTRSTLLRRLRAGGRVALRELRPDLPVPLAEVIDRTLALDPAARPRDARQLEAAMRAASGGLLRAEAEPPIEAAAKAGGAEVPGGRFIGRRNELDSVGAALLRSRLVTLVGAGGAGKTRLAGEAIGRLTGLFPDGVVWVSLAPLAQPEDVLREIAHRADVHESGGTGLEQRLHEALADKESLVALDNCEHLLEACAETIGSLLEACPRVRVLATSRAPLGLQEEELLRLRPMETPPRTAAGGVDGMEIAIYESVRLFVDRVAQARPGFLLTRENAAAVARICRRLDGLPLALELAAARARGLALEEIASRLEEGFRILDRSGAGLGSSHETLHASIDWSWSLLAEPARALLGRLSVFAGRWSLAAAEAVAGSEGDPLRSPGDVPDLLDALVEHSLVVFEPPTERRTAPGLPGGESPLSYRLLEPIREFAGRRLAESGEEDRVQSRHLRWAVDVATRGDRSLYGKEQGPWVSLLEEMHDDFRSALRWAQRSAVRAEEGLELALKLRRFWYVRGYSREGPDHFLRLLALDGPRPALRGRALACCGSLVLMRGDHLEARRLCEEGLALLSEDEDPAGRASALSTLGVICTEMEEPAAARAYLEVALPLHRKHGSKASIPGVLNNLGVCAACMEDLDGAIGYYEEALSICRDLGDSAQAAIMANNLSGSYLERGNLERARAFADEAIDRAVAGRDRRTVRLALLARAEVAVTEGETARARELAREALDYQTQEQDWPAAVSAAKVLLQILLGSGRAPEAAEILGVLRAHQDRKEERYYPGHQRKLAHAEAELRAALGDAAAEAAFRRGALLKLEDLVSRLSGGPA